MPAFLDFHSMGRYTEDDLKKSQKDPRDEFGVKVLNTFYDLDSGTMFCLVDAPDKYAVERHHSKFGINCDWITPVKMTSEYGDSKLASE
jgi:Protein of unknown function (DUF4242)